MPEDENHITEIQETREQKIAKRIFAVSVALFFLMIGGFGLVPEGSIPSGAWLIGVGLIVLGSNYARYAYGLKTVGFTILLGILALIAGISDLAGIELPLFPILLILVGLSILLKVIRGEK